MSVNPKTDESNMPNTEHFVDTANKPTAEEVAETLAKKALLLRYRENQEAKEQRKKEAMETRAKEAEIKRIYAKEQQKAKDEARQFERDAKRGERERLNAERNQRRQTAVALEEELSITTRQYEEALIARNAVRGTVARKERVAAEAEDEANKAFKIMNAATIRFNTLNEKKLNARKQVQEAKSPSIDTNLASLKTKLSEGFYTVQKAWECINPKKRRKELQNNELRKRVRALIR